MLLATLRMKIKHTLGIITFIFLFFPNFGFSQDIGRIFINNFSPKTYRGGTQNWAITQTPNGVLYFANNNGVLEYDGSHWALIPVLDNLPVRHIASTQDGTVYVGSVGEFGLLKPDSIGQLHYHSLISKIPEEFRSFKDVWRVFTTDNGVFFFSRGHLFRWKNDKIKAWKIRDASLLNCVNNTIYHNERDVGLQIVQGDSLVMAPQGEQLKNQVFFFMIPFGADSILLGSAQKGLLMYTPDTVYQFETEATQLIQQNRIYHGSKLNNQEFAICTRRGGLFIINKRGELLRRINQESGLSNHNIKYSLPDRKGNLWLGLNNGIAFVETASPWQFWNEGNQLVGTVYKVLRHDSLLYAGTAQGLFRLQGESVTPIQGTKDATWDLLSFSPDSSTTLLLSAENEGVNQLVGNQVRQIRKSLTAFHLYQSQFYPNRVYIGLKDGVAAIEYVNGKWIDKGYVNGLKDQVRNIVEVNANQLWASMAYKGILKIDRPYSDNPTLTFYDTSHGLPSLKNILISQINGQYYFTTSKGIYQFNDASQRFEPATKLDPLYKQPTTLLEIDKEQRLWTRSTEYFGQLAYWKPMANKWKAIQAPFKRLPETSVNFIYPETANQVWLGGSEGLFCFNKDIVSTSQTNYAPIIRAIAINQDSLIYKGHGVPNNNPIPYRYNSLQFRFAFPSFENKDRNQFAVKIEGLEGFENWSDWFVESSKEFNNIPEGTYTLSVKAQNTYEQESPAIQYQFTILPPWYRHWGAYLCYLLLAVFGVWAIVKWNIKRLKTENKELDNLVQLKTKQLASSLEKEKEGRVKIEKAMADLQEAQMHLVQSEKMSSLGQLTAGIAHEINNPINFVLAGATTLQGLIEDLQQIIEQYSAINVEDSHQVIIQKLNAIEQFKEGIYFDELNQDVGDMLDDISAGAVRTQKIVDSLKIFAHTEHEAFAQADLVVNMEATLTILSNHFEEHVQITQEIAPDLPLIHCCISQINQVFMGLLVNASQAIQEQGTIHIRMWHEQSERKCYIQIKDSGHGIKEADLEHIFEPFFTTKDIGDGVGLGLSMVHGIITNHHGSIEVESELGKGSTFTIGLLIDDPDNA